VVGSLCARAQPRSFSPLQHLLPGPRARSWQNHPHTAPPAAHTIPMNTTTTGCSDYPRKFNEKGLPVYGLWVRRLAE